MSKEAIEALEAARAHILDAYRIWQADDVSAVPPPKSGAGAVIAKIDAVLSTLPIAVEGKAPEGWQLVPVEFTQAHYERMIGRTLVNIDRSKFSKWEEHWEWMLNTAPTAPSSPGKDGGQEVVAWAYEGRDSLPGSEWLPRVSLTLVEECAANRKTVRNVRPLYASPQPASTALVERLTDEQLRDIADSKDTATCRARLLAALSASTSREGER